MKKQTLYIIITLTTIFLSLFGIIIKESRANKSPNITYRENDSGSYPYFNNEAIDKKIKSYLNGSNNYVFNVIDNNIISILFDDSSTYRTILFDYRKNSDITLNDIVTDSSRLYENIYSQLANKYPRFIADYIKTNNFSNLNYFVDKNQIIIHFDITGITPAVNEDIYLNLNYNDIKGILKIGYTLDENYSNINKYVIDPTKKTIALTFDDGPDKNTADLVKILKDNHANATFFVLGSKVNSHIDAIKQSIALGNEYGCHSYSHKYLTKINAESLKYETTDMISSFNNTFNYQIKYVRPPYGAYNSKVLENVDYPLILWSIDSKDWSYRNTDKDLNEILSNIKDKAIILMHETYKPSIEAVSKLLPELYARGYQVVTVSKLLELNNMEVTAHNAYRRIK